MNDIQKAIQGARAAQVGRIYGGFSNAQEVTSDESKLTKGDESEQIDGEENPFEKAASEDEEKEPEKEEETEKEPSEVEKSDIMNALDYGSSIKVSKTGKEIKKQITDVVLPELNAELAVKKNEANEKLKDCGSAPTKEPETYWTAGIKMDCGHKVYDWEETYVPRKEGVSVDTLSAEDAIDKHVNVPENQEQSNARRAYNDCVRAICNIMVDIKACEILGSLKDGTEYELTPRQMTTFKF